MDPHLDVNYIRHVCKEIFESKNTQTQEKLASKYSEIVRKYPRLWKMIFNSNDMTNLNLLFDSMAQVKSGKIGYEDQSKKVGKMLFNQYVQPVLDEKNISLDPKRLDEIADMDI